MPKIIRDPALNLPELPKKNKNDSDFCIKCSHHYDEHQVYEGGKCAECHDRNKGFRCDAFNKGKILKELV